MNRSILFRALCLPLSILPALAIGADDVPIAARPSITVQGEGMASAAPDTVFITMGVETQAEQAGEALESNSEAMSDLMDTLERADVPNKNVQTVTFNVSPIYQSERPPEVGAGSEPTHRVVGYRVTNQVRIKLNKIEMLGELLDQVVGVGANSIYGIQFDIEDSKALMDAARKDAVADARRKAAVLAAAAGVALGAPLQITEAGAAGPPQPMYRMTMMAESAVPIAEGQQQLTVNVTIVYALGEQS